MKNLLHTAFIAILFGCLLFAGCSSGTDSSQPALGNLLILQAYGNGGTGSPGGVSHTFVELYNISNKAIKLNGISLYYASGVRGPDVTADEPWKRIALSGTIPAKGSFLILGEKHDEASSNTRYHIDDGYGDINDNNFILSRRSFKVALIEGSAELTVPNPYNDGNPISGYIDMVGAANDINHATNPDNIFGYATAPARNSASEAVRRKDDVDTENNKEDFESIRYASDGISGEELLLRHPRNSSAGSWDPFADPPPLPEDVDYSNLVLNEVNGASNQKWFEIYNKGNVEVSLYGVTANYDNGSGYNNTPTWTGLSTDVIPAKGYFATPRGDGSNLGTGLSANNVNVKLQLRCPDGTVLDTYQKPADVNTNIDGNYPALSNRAHARIPDGTGDWYYLNNRTGTHGVTNGTSTTGYTKFGDEANAIPLPDADYTGLRLNEISGEHKYVEIYNSSSSAISLENVRLDRNDGGSSWTGSETDSIPAGAYRIFLFNSFTPANKDTVTYPSAPATNDGNATYSGDSTLVDKTTGLNAYPQFMGGLSSGISDNQILKVALIAPSGTPIDVFIRGDAPLSAWGTSGATRVRTHSYSRMSDGSWAYAIPTPGAANGAKVSDILTPGYLTSQP